MKDKKFEEEEFEEEEFEEEEYEEEDDEEEGSFDAILKNNKNLAIAGGILIIAVIALFYFFNSGNEEEAEAASLALSRILPYYATQNYEMALNGNPQATVRGGNVIGLLSISDRYEDTEEGKLAALYAANSYLSTGKINEARSYFETAKDAESDITRSGAFAGLGACFENSGNFMEAADNYLTAADLSGDVPGKLRYQYYAATCYEQAGEKEKAINNYREIIKNENYSEFSGLAKERLIGLGTIIE